MNLRDLPENKNLTYLGYTTYRDRNQLFGIKRKDRRQHMYILGKSGTGKSALMANMAIQNIVDNEGVCIVDPHGEFIEDHVIPYIPEHRLKDVVYFNPADDEYHMGFNVLEITDPKYKNLVASGLMGIFTKIWANAWSARMEYILNNAILALLDTPGTTMLGITRMLVDKDYRQNIIKNLKDPVIKAFWVHEYEAWQDKFRNEAIAPIQNKVGQFLSSSVIRNIVGQSKSTINIFDMMNEGKIFLVNVSKGRIGEDNSRLLGGMIITKIQLAAMERVRIPEDLRKDFYLYVDEFQNFVTDSFASILSEARKYRLSLTVAHQYTAQLVTKESSAMRDSIFGNVGTMIIFRVGADDASFLENEFQPEFMAEDIVNLPNYKVYLKLMIDGITSRPFSAKTIPPLVVDNVAEGNAENVINISRDKYCRTRPDVEREINEWSGMSFVEEKDGKDGKFKAICATCGKETWVPFKPDPNRPVYCKDCMEKIKAGELKPIKRPSDQERHSKTNFFRPLAELGIEFPLEEGEKVTERQPKPIKNSNRPNKKPDRFNKHPKGPRKNFEKNPREDRRNHEDKSALRAVLGKVFDGKDDPEIKVEEVKEVKEPPKEQKTISLKSLEEKIESQKKEDRGADKNTMNSLKDLIQNIPDITPAPKEQEQKDDVKPKVKPHPRPVNQDKKISSGAEKQKRPREIPEEVLRQILSGD